MNVSQEHNLKIQTISSVFIGFFFFVVRAWSICPGCTAAYEAYCATLIPPPRNLDVHTSDARHLHVHTTRVILATRGGTCGRECWPIILPKCRPIRYIQGSFTCRKSAAWDWRLYFPSEGRCAEDSFALKNPDSRVWTRELGYLKGSTLPLDHRSRSWQGLNFTGYETVLNNVRYDILQWWIERLLSSGMCHRVF